MVVLSSHPPLLREKYSPKNGVLSSVGSLLIFLHFSPLTFDRRAVIDTVVFNAPCSRAKSCSIRGGCLQMQLFGYGESMQPRAALRKAPLFTGSRWLALCRREVLPVHTCSSKEALWSFPPLFGRYAYICTHQHNDGSGGSLFDLTCKRGNSRGRSKTASEPHANSTRRGIKVHL